MRLLTILIPIVILLLFSFSNIINPDNELIEQSQPRGFVRRTGPSGCTYIPGGSKVKMCEVAPPPPPQSPSQPAKLHCDPNSDHDPIPCGHQATKQISADSIP